MAKTEIIRNAKGQEICGAKKKGGGVVCQSPVLGAGGRCWLFLVIY